MDGRLIKVFLACALGAAIGSVVALSVYSYLWWVGLLVGGAVGYLSYEFKETARAFRVAIVFAWRKVVPASSSLAVGVFRKITCTTFFTGLMRLFLVLLWPVAFLVSMFLVHRILYLLNLLSADIDKSSGEFAVFVLGMDILIIAGLISAFMGEFVYNTLRYGFHWHYAIPIKWLVIVSVCLSPIGLIALGPLALIAALAGIGWTIVNSGKIARFCAVFTAKFFRTIHSDIRLLCGSAAVVGALVGFLLVNPIIGAMTGGIIGVLYYKLVDQKWLRLHTREQNGG